jgi:hypothetical protein
MAEDQQRSGAKTRIATRFLTPIAAAAASATAGYLVRKGPDYFDRVLLPRLRELAGEAGNVTQDLPAKAASVATGAGDIAQDLGDRAKALVGSGSQPTTGSHRLFSPQELEKRRQDRARSRAARRKPRAA